MPTASASCVHRQAIITLTISGSGPGLQFYSGQYLSRAHPGIGSGVALEPQGLPDAPNHPGFPDAILRPGRTYRARIEYRFSCSQTWIDQAADVIDRDADGVALLQSEWRGGHDAGARHQQGALGKTAFAKQVGRQVLEPARDLADRHAAGEHDLPLPRGSTSAICASGGSGSSRTSTPGPSAAEPS